MRSGSALWAGSFVWADAGAATKRTTSCSNNNLKSDWAIVEYCSEMRSAVRWFPNTGQIYSSVLSERPLVSNLPGTSSLCDLCVFAMGFVLFVDRLSCPGSPRHDPRIDTNQHEIMRTESF